MPPVSSSASPPIDDSVRRDFDLFERLVSIGEELLAAGRVPSAAACAEIAATCAWRNHPGLFASPRLERLLHALGVRLERPRAVRRVPTSNPAHVLHVMSKARRMGGDSRFVCRWIQSDGGRRHSIAVTTQLDEEIPELFVESTGRAGGRVHALDAGTRDPMERARRLAALVKDVDLVVLHLYPDDIVPLLAFAHKDGLPPVAFIHHSDHTFWLGVNITDLLVQLRGCSVSLSTGRRRVAADRLCLLPIPLPLPERTLSRPEAKAALGLPEDAMVLLSVGTGFKYEPIAGPGFLEVLRPLVDAHDKAVLLVVGPRPTGAWAAAAHDTNGRIQPLGPRYDTATLFQAADIYLDSFPFTSPTAALEAGTYGLPLVAFCPRDGDARVLGPGAPGLDHSMVRLRDVAGYRATLAELLIDEARRRELGTRARQTIADLHTGPRWTLHLRELYRAAAAARPAAVPAHADQCVVDEVDIVVNGLYRTDAAGIGGFIDRYVRPLPFPARVAVLRRLLACNRAFSFDMFLPGRIPAWRPPGWRRIRGFLPRTT